MNLKYFISMLLNFKVLVHHLTLEQLKLRTSLLKLVSYLSCRISFRQKFLLLGNNSSIYGFSGMMVCSFLVLSLFRFHHLRLCPYQLFLNLTFHPTIEQSILVLNTFFKLQFFSHFAELLFLMLQRLQLFIKVINKLLVLDFLPIL